MLKSFHSQFPSFSFPSFFISRPIFFLYPFIPSVPFYRSLLFPLVHSLFFPLSLYPLILSFSSLPFSSLTPLPFSSLLQNSLFKFGNCRIYSCAKRCGIPWLICSFGLFDIFALIRTWISYKINVICWI